jgi:LysR family transcriptional activator of nhaA
MTNFNHLYYFFIYVRAGTVQKAASALSISQPALSTQLKVFESVMGGLLFDRSGYKLKLTKKGDQIYRYACRMFEIHDELQEFVDNPDTFESPNKLHIGVCDQVERPFAVDLISRFIREEAHSKKIFGTLTSGGHDQLIGHLLDKSLDVIITNQPSYHDRVQILGQLPLPVILAVPASQNISKKMAIRLNMGKGIGSALNELNMPFVMPSSTLRLRSEMDTYLERQKYLPHVIFEADLLAAITRAIVDQLGSCFIPRSYLAGELNRNTVQVFGPSEGFWNHTVWVLGRKSPLIRSRFERLSVILQELT